MDNDNKNSIKGYRVARWDDVTRIRKDIEYLQFMLSDGDIVMSNSEREKYASRLLVLQGELKSAEKADDEDNIGWYDKEVARLNVTISKQNALIDDWMDECVSVRSNSIIEACEDRIAKLEEAKVTGKLRQLRKRWV